ncbi:hypothetical protein AALO_G00046140, partial [Alosa alosa]
MSTARKELVWSIKKNLYKLSGTEAYHLAKDIATASQGTNTLEPSDEEGCVDYILSYMKSDSLSSSEDEGMSQLLMLNDLVCFAIENRIPAVITKGVEKVKDIPTAPSPAVGYTHTTPDLPSPSSTHTHYTTLPSATTTVHTTQQHIGLNTE